MSSPGDADAQGILGLRIPLVRMYNPGMGNEIEVKFKVDGFDAVRKALRREGAEYLSTVLQTDCYFDTPDGSLYRRGSGLRLRQVRYIRFASGRRDDRPLLTFKGPRVQSKRTKIRPEFETRLDCMEAVVEILGACGLGPLLTLQKRRSSYRLGRCEVCLDQVPLIGRFVEIEGVGEGEVHSLARKLGLKGESILLSYVHLLSDHCRRQGLEFKEITFDEAGS